MEERLVRLQEFSNETDLNRVELHDTKIGVICAGICYQSPGRCSATALPI